MAPTTRKIKNPTPGASASGKKKPAPKKIARQSKHALPKVDPIKQAAERLRMTHLFATATSHSPAHDKKCKKFLEEFSVSLQDLKEQLGPELLELVDSPYGGTVPKLIIEMGGISSLDKRRIVSVTVFNWISKKRRERGELSFHEPVTLMQYVRTFFGYAKNLYDWPYSLDHDFNFEGALLPSLSQLFQERRKYDINYGGRSSVAILKNVESVEEIDIFGKERGKPFFDTNDAMELMMLMLLIHGLYFGFRGNKEHTYLVISNFARDTFGKGHEFEGKEYWTIQNMEDKKNKLSATNTKVKPHNGAKIPVDSEPGQVIEYYLSVISPGQERVYCKPATVSQRLNFSRIGHPNAIFSPNQPLGQHTVANLMKSAMTKIGYPNGTGHSLRRVYGTSLANDPRVSEEAALQAMRHTSVASYRMYQVVGKKADAAKMAALGIKKIVGKKVDAAKTAALGIDKLAKLSLDENEGEGSV